IIAFIVITLTPLAFAGDGQIDIASLPYTITEPGSYVVVANLTLTDLDTDGITIDADDVTVDLNGHTLTGPGSAAGTSGNGIRAGDGGLVSRSRITVHGGTVTGFRQRGIWLFGGRNVVRDMIVHDNGWDGINCESTALISDCIVTQSGLAGISAGAGSIISRCIAEVNGGSGISTGGSVIIVQNNCRQNTGFGIEASNALVAENTCVSNTAGTFSVFFSTSVDNHTAP
ncbi:right-handed parallel beta-helix repeat-containing protein, partial [Candidatus Sumerlaeota bacterium]|nr:right-handed parallel beta-helix repeat-containing protein [Candidatus Sumerlaeota bacterium]